MQIMPRIKTVGLRYEYDWGLKPKTQTQLRHFNGKSKPEPAESAPLNGLIRSCFS